MLGGDLAWVKRDITDYAVAGTTLAFTRFDSDIAERLDDAFLDLVSSKFYKQLCCDYRSHGVDLGGFTRRYPSKLAPT